MRGRQAYGKHEFNLAKRTCAFFQRTSRIAQSLRRMAEERGAPRRVLFFTSSLERMQNVGAVASKGTPRISVVDPRSGAV